MNGKRKRILAGLSALVLALALGAACPALGQPPEGSPRRIISLAPSTTEILFALGLEDRVAGVTRYCDYPAEARNLPTVGGYLDPSYEEIVALHPDLVILLTSHQDALKELSKIGMPTLTVPHLTTGDIQEAVRKIGRACGAGERAEAFLAGLSQRTRAVENAVKGRERPRVLICIGRDTGSDQLQGMYMAGSCGFYDEIIRMAGGVNALGGQSVAYPQMSAEGVIRVNPDVIVELVSHIDPDSADAERIRGHWNRLAPVKAVRRGRVCLVAGTHALRPGPRYVDFLEDLARFLHPGAFSGEDSHE